MIIFSGGDIHPEQLIRTWIILMFSVALICFLVSELTRNYSQVDKLWSLMPVVYSAITLGYYPSPRLWIMFLLVCLWGVRLSYNFSRKGGYHIIPWKGAEDYRWIIMRQNPNLSGRVRFGLFNLFFISFYQNLIIILFSAPLLMAAKYQNSSLTFTDISAAALMLIFVLTESVADNQQYRFQKLKRQNKNPDGIFALSLKRGFLSEGLWQYVRHPNFISEQLIWLSFYLFGAAASGKWINWTLAGSFLLVLLFLGSTELTERISSSKYPDYGEYKMNVPKFFPRIFRSKKQ